MFSKSVPTKNPETNIITIMQAPNKICPVFTILLLPAFIRVDVDFNTYGTYLYLTGRVVVKEFKRRLRQND